jgi:dihydrofolate reductase
MNNTLLVGYKTYQTLPKLKDRTVIVDNDNIDVNEIDWCIGGKKTYEKYCHYFTELHISIVDDDTIGDTMFPDLKNLPVSCKIFYYNFKKD